MAQAFNQPFVIILVDEGADNRAGLLEAFEAVQIEALLLERANEAFSDPVALRLSDVRGR